MGFRPGKGVPFGLALVGGLTSVALIAGLSAGISIEDGKKKNYNSRLSELKSELTISKQIADDINITPPNGKGFINHR